MSESPDIEAAAAKQHLKPAQRDTLTSSIRVLHPALLALQPVFGLYANNAGKTSFSGLLRPAAALAGGGILVWLLLRAVIKDKYRAGVAASILIVATLAGWNFLEYFIGVLEPVVRTIPWLAFNAVYGVVCVICLALYWRQYSAERRVGISIAVLALIWVAALIVTYVVFRPAFGAVPAASIVCYVAAIFLALAIVLRSGSDFVAWTQTLNWFAGVLLGLYLLLALGNLWRMPPEPRVPPNAVDAAAPVSPEEASKCPDIYFVALEGYARPDVLERTYGYDMAPFLAAMKSKGYEALSGTRSNYALALFSLTSCLNMDYLQDVLGDRATSANPFAEVFNVYHQNKVYSYLKSKGYSLHALAQGSEPLDPRENVDVVHKPMRSLTEFERVLAKSTVALRAVQLERYLRSDTPAMRRAEFIRRQVQFVVDGLSDLAAARDAGPRFIFASLAVPCGPAFAFDRDGNWPKVLRSSYDTTGAFTGTSSEFKAAYVDQVVYVNTLLEKLAGELHERAKRPSIVLFVSSNGPWFETTAVEKSSVDDRYSNLVLVSFPPELGGATPLFTGENSLVNLFPVTFNRVFSASLPVHPDATYISTPTHPLEFKPISLSR